MMERLWVSLFISALHHIILEILTRILGRQLLQPSHQEVDQERHP
jgi:hypothetical protein